LLENQRWLTLSMERETNQVAPHVSHRNGKPLRSFHQVWRSACAEAGHPGRLFRDLRGTAVRELERAGVPRSVATQLSGQKTENIYRRHASIAEADLAEGVARRSEFRTRTRTVPAQSAGSGPDAKDVPGA
jgi:hypothetical protein